MFKLWKPPGDAKGSHGTWTFVGRLVSGKEISLVISDKGAEIKAPAGNQQWTLSPRFSESVRQPTGCGSLLPAASSLSPDEGH